jgi:hypothetical protein
MNDLALIIQSLPDSLVKSVVIPSGNGNITTKDHNGNSK